MSDPLKDSEYYQRNNEEYNRKQQGIFALNPLMSPKYSINRVGGDRDAEYRETMARMYVSLADADPGFIDKYILSLPKEVQGIAAILISKTQQTGFIDFLLANVQEQFSEKLQVDEVLSDNYVAFYFGQAPPVFQFSGALINSQQDDQRIGWVKAYQHLLRGHALAKGRGLLRIRYDSVIVSGTINDTSMVLQAGNELVVPFSFSMLVKEYVIVGQTRFTKLSLDDFVQLDVPITTKYFEEERERYQRISTTLVPVDSGILTPANGGALDARLGAARAATPAASLTGDVRGTLPGTISPSPTPDSAVQEA